MTRTACIRAAAGKNVDYVYDKVGNWNLFWDDSATALPRSHSAANEITAIDSSSSNLGHDVAVYSYDAMGRRIEKIDKTGESDVTYTYYYTPGWQLLEVYKDGGADVYEQFVWGGQYIDEALRRQRDTDTDGTFDDTLFHIQDGTPR